MTRDALRDRARELGADLFGVADLAQAAGLETEPADLFEGFRRAVVVGVKLLDAVVEQCQSAPTPLYEHHYLTVNARLDAVADGLARALEAAGARALPLPASLMLDKQRLTGHVSHKALARLAGLGWQGKSLLIVNPEVGPRFRVATVLTDRELPADAPLRNRCGSCTRCAEACPAGAIKNVATDSHYADRDAALHFRRCADLLLQDFMQRPGLSKPVCGVCVRACPWGGAHARRAG